MTNSIGVMIEGLVTILLMLTIGYCWLLNQRLKCLKADEHSLRATISELVIATQIAERAIGGLKLTVADCERGLAVRLASAERFSADLDRGIAAGKQLFDRLVQIAAAGAGNGGASTVRADTSGAAEAVAQWQNAVAPRADARAVAVAAQAFAERLRLKARGIAA